MCNRTQKIFVQAGVILGFVVPFVLGAFAERLMPRIEKPVSRTIDSTDDPRDDQTVWYDFGNDGDQDGRIGIKYWLDYRRALADARLSHRPVLLLFTGVNDTNSRFIHKNVMRAPTVIARLRQFACAVMFVDVIPGAERAEVDRLTTQNWKLLEEWLGDIAIPRFVVVHADFEITGDLERRKPLAAAYGREFRDEATAVRFLDEAMQKWAETQPAAR